MWLAESGRLAESERLAENTTYQLAERGRLAEKTRYQLAEIGRLAESGRLVKNTKHQSTELAETRQRVYLTKVGDWPKEPTDDRADRRKSRLTSGKEACSGVLIVDFWSKWSCVFLDTRSFGFFPGDANLQLKTVRSFQNF